MLGSRLLPYSAPLDYAVRRADGYARMPPVLIARCLMPLVAIAAHAALPPLILYADAADALPPRRCCRVVRHDAACCRFVLLCHAAFDIRHAADAAVYADAAYFAAMMSPAATAYAMMMLLMLPPYARVTLLLLPRCRHYFDYFRLPLIFRRHFACRYATRA